MADVNTSDLRYAVRLQIGAVLVALIAAGAFISVPVPGSPVPIVLQNMFVVLTGVVLAPSWAALLDGPADATEGDEAHDFEGEIHDLPWRNDY